MEILLMMQVNLTEIQREAINDILFIAPDGERERIIFN